MAWRVTLAETEATVGRGWLIATCGCAGAGDELIERLEGESRWWGELTAQAIIGDGAAAGSTLLDRRGVRTPVSAGRQ